MVLTALLTGFSPLAAYLGKEIFIFVRIIMGLAEVCIININRGKKKENFSMNKPFVIINHLEGFFVLV